MNIKSRIITFGNLSIKFPEKISSMWMRILFALLVLLPLMEAYVSILSILNSLLLMGYIFIGFLVVFVDFSFDSNFAFKKNWLYLFFLGYCLSIALNHYSGFSGIKRLGILGIYYLVLVFDYEIIRREGDYRSVLKWLVICLYIYLLVANILNRNYSITLDDIRYDRYWGINGINFHGFISAVTIMLTFHIEIGNKSKLKHLALLYAAFNLYMTGSRAAILVVGVYFIVCYLLKILSKKTIGRFIMALIVTLLAFIGVIIFFVKNPSIAAEFRFDAWGLSTRFGPVINGFNIMKANNFKAYGLGGAIIDSLLQDNPLDNMYLLLGIEIGLIGVIILVLYLVSVCWKYLKYIASYPSSKKNVTKFEVGSLVALIAALIFYALFENFIFNGFLLGTFILMYVIAALYYKTNNSDDECLL